MRHEFSFYTEQLSPAFIEQNGNTITIADEQLYHRLKHVVRAQVGDLVILFDATIAIEAKLGAFFSKNKLQFSSIKILKKALLTPSITVLFPLLKREAFADALYSCVELGANHIQLITTEKSHHVWSEQRDPQRCKKIMIAAAEQAKQFNLPTLRSPISLTQSIDSLPNGSFRLHCDPDGTALWQVINDIQQQKSTEIVMSFGPEGDFVAAERELLYKNQFIGCALTPTVLRSTQALVVALGALRSCINSQAS